MMVPDLVHKDIRQPEDRLCFGPQRAGDGRRERSDCRSWLPPWYGENGSTTAAPTPTPASTHAVLQ